MQREKREGGKDTLLHCNTIPRYLCAGNEEQQMVHLRKMHFSVGKGEIQE